MEEDAIKSDGYESYCSTSQDMRKHSKLSEEDRLARCRERNKIHARNTRERKKVQLGALQLRFQKLMDEKLQLERKNDDSLAHILISLGGLDNEFAEANNSKDDTISSHARMQADLAIEKIRASISALLSDDEDIGESSESLIQKQKNYSSTSDLVMIRRERNKLHAKRTRMRKKKMLAEMESLIAGLEKEIATLKKYKSGVASSSSDLSNNEAEKNDNESSEQTGDADEADMAMAEDFPGDELDSKSCALASTGTPATQSVNMLTLNDGADLKSTFARYQKFPKLMLPISSLVPTSSSYSTSPFIGSGGGSSSIKVHASTSTSAVTKSSHVRNSHSMPVMRDTETQTMDIRDYPESLLTASRLDPPQLTRRSSIGSEADFFVTRPRAASVTEYDERSGHLLSPSGAHPNPSAEHESNTFSTAVSDTKKQQDKNDDDAIDSLILLSSR